MLRWRGSEDNKRRIVSDIETGFTTLYAVVIDDI